MCTSDNFLQLYEAFVKNLKSFRMRGLKRGWECNRKAEKSLCSSPAEDERELPISIHHSVYKLAVWPGSRVPTESVPAQLAGHFLDHFPYCAGTWPLSQLHSEKAKITAKWRETQTLHQRDVLSQAALSDHLDRQPFWSEDEAHRRWDDGRSRAAPFE